MLFTDNLYSTVSNDMCNKSPDQTASVHCLIVPALFTPLSVTWLIYCVNTGPAESRYALPLQTV